MLNTTLLYLIKRENHTIDEILLAMKMRGMGEGKWNGVGGKVEANETITQELIREVREEIEVKPIHFWEVAKINFRFPSMPHHDQVMHAYFCDQWRGSPQETEEMRPQWFEVSDLPYGQMWSADSLWLPQALEGQYTTGEVVYSDFEVISEKNLHFELLQK